MQSSYITSVFVRLKKWIHLTNNCYNSCRSYNLKIYPRRQLIFNLHTRAQSPVHCLIRFLDAVWRLFSIYMNRAQKDTRAEETGMKDFRPLAAFCTGDRWGWLDGERAENPSNVPWGLLCFFAVAPTFRHSAKLPLNICLQFCASIFFPTINLFGSWLSFLLLFLWLSLP